jgi:hypothetical protein
VTNMFVTNKVPTKTRPSIPLILPWHNRRILKSNMKLRKPHCGIRRGYKRVT